MAKLTLNDIVSGYASNTALNDNFALIETALENTLSRDGTSPNTMSANLDMNGYRIINELAGVAVGVWKGDWLTGTAYVVNDLVYIPSGTGGSKDGWTQICTVAHTSGAFSTDKNALKWADFAARGASGGGAGDLVSTNNLSDLTNTTTARTNLGITATGNLVATASSITNAFDAIAPTTTAGDILYHNGTDNIRLAKGTASQLLRMNTGATAPEWATVSSSGIAGETTYNTNTTLSLTTDHTYVIRCTVASVVYTFPAATGNEGKYWWITNQTATDTGVRLVADGAESIGGATGTTIYIPAYTTIGFISDGTNWIVFSYSGKTSWTFTATGTWYCPPGKNAALGTIIGGGSSGIQSTGAAANAGGLTSIGALLTAAGGAAPVESTYVAPATPDGTLGDAAVSTRGGAGLFGMGGVVHSATARAATGYGSGGASTRADLCQGQGGARRIKEAITPVPGTTYPITIGAGGAAGTGNSAGTSGLAIVELN